MTRDRDPAQVEIMEVFPGRRRDRRLFARLPFDLADSFDHWRPGVRWYSEGLIHPRRNPFWRNRSGSFFLALRDGEVVGRMGVVDPGTLPELHSAAVLVMPDFVDDDQVTSTLLEAMEARARERGAREIIGPMNPNIHHDLGVLVEGFNKPNAVFMGYQPPYYRRHFEREGYDGIADFHAWGLKREDFLREGRLHRLVQRVERSSSLRIRSVDMKRFDADLRVFFHLYTQAFSDHWGFVPPTWEEFKFIAGDIRYILRTRLALVAEWDGEPVGFVLSVPDLYSAIPKTQKGKITPQLLLTLWKRWKSVEGVRVMIAGVLPTHRSLGIHLPLFYRMAQEIFDLGFRGGEISWVYDGNTAMAKALPLLGAFHTKTYRLYHKPLLK